MLLPLFCYVAADDDSAVFVFYCCAFNRDFLFKEHLESIGLGLCREFVGVHRGITVVPSSLKGVNKGIVGGVKMTLGCPTTVPKGHHIPRILANLPKSFPGEKEI